MPVVGRIGKLLAEFIGDFLQIGGSSPSAGKPVSTGSWLVHVFKLYGVHLAPVVKKKNLPCAEDVMLNCLGAAGLWCREFFYHLLVESADIAPAFPLQFIADAADALVVVFTDFIKEVGRQLLDSLLRVCQQTGRNGIGIDINPEYIKMTQERLQEPFSGFDSIDERMRRIPNDLNDACYRQAYIQNHINWFLKNHPDMARDFMREVSAKYPSQEESSLFVAGT